MDKCLEQLHEAVRDFLWDQWVALGVAGRSTGKEIPFVVDPEALLLATLRFGIEDGRLMAEVMDWLSKNGGLISLQRLKNVQSSSQVGTQEGLEELGYFMEQAGFRNWKTLSSWAKKLVPGKSQTLMSESESLRGMSQAPDCSRPENFMLRMRGIFGVSARPEILTWLLTHDSGYAAEIARETGWFSKSAQAILNDLELSGLVISYQQGKKKFFSLNPRDKTLDPELGDGVHWFSQGLFYLGLFCVVRTLERVSENPNATVGAQAIAIRKEMTPMSAAFRLARTEDPFAGGASLIGKELVQCFEEGVGKLLEMLGKRSFR